VLKVDHKEFWILDFGFWIESLPAGSSSVSSIQNRKSKIENLNSLLMIKYSPLSTVCQSKKIGVDAVSTPKELRQ